VEVNRHIFTSQPADVRLNWSMSWSPTVPGESLSPHHPYADTPASGEFSCR